MDVSDITPCNVHSDIYHTLPFLYLLQLITKLLLPFHSQIRKVNQTLRFILSLAQFAFLKVGGKPAARRTFVMNQVLFISAFCDDASNVVRLVIVLKGVFKTP